MPKCIRCKKDKPRWKGTGLCKSCYARSTSKKRIIGTRFFPPVKL